MVTLSIISSRAEISTMAPVFKLAPGVQDYAWGKKGSSSLAAQFGKVCVTDFEIDEEKTYAEVSWGREGLVVVVLPTVFAVLVPHGVAP